MAVKQTDNPSISAQFHKAKKDKILSDAEASATLMGLISGDRETITVDIDGTPVEIYEPSPRQLLPLQQVSVEILRYKAESERKKRMIGDDEEVTEELLSTVCEGFESLQQMCEISDQLLADLTVDPLLTYEAFASGLIPETKKAQILNAIRKWSDERIKQKEKIANFRGNGKRARSP